MNRHIPQYSMVTLRVHPITFSFSNLSGKLEAYLPEQTAVVITNQSLSIHYCTPLFSKLCGKEQIEIVERNIFDLLSDFSDVFKDDSFRKDILAHTNSFTTLKIGWPLWSFEIQRNFPKTIISHASFADDSTVTKRIFTFTITKPIAVVERSEKDSTPADQNQISTSSSRAEANSSYLIETNERLRREIRRHQTALKALQESELRFRNLTETTSDFIWEIDANGLYTYASPKCYEILGYSPEELLGHQYLLLRNPATADKFFSEIQTRDLQIKKFKDWNYTFKHKDGQEITMQSSGEPVFKTLRNRTLFAGFRGIDRDITQGAIYEKRLRLAKEAAERANDAKSDFLANMSHELRTPLHAILSYSRYGEKKYQDSPRSDLGHYFNQISKSAHRLFPFIDGLLDLSKLEAGKMEYTFCFDDIREEFSQALAEFTPLAEERKINFKLNDPPFKPVASFDRQRLGQVIRNILSNALKFSTPGSTVEIFFHKDKALNNSDCLRTTIINTGIGIPKNESEAIFDKFYQSSFTRTGAGGTGLGLSICRRILNDMHGIIWAESENGLTSFHFTLPTSEQPEKIGQILLKEGLVSEENLTKALWLQKKKK